MFGKTGHLNKTSKKVNQINMDTGNIINTFSSTIEAEKVTGILNTAIQNCCKGRSKKSGGYIWKYI
jgi:hypothetical protein